MDIEQSTERRCEYPERECRSGKLGDESNPWVAESVAFSASARSTGQMTDDRSNSRGQATEVIVENPSRDSPSPSDPKLPGR